MKIEFCIPNRNTYEIVKTIFNDISDIIVSNTQITLAAYPVIIAAGNSFAEMNGGVDGAINSFLSSYTPDRYLQSDVKEALKNYFAGELPVGQSILVETYHPKYRHLIYTPTMRVAEDVSKTINAYLAFRGALLLMKNKNVPAASTTLFCSGAGCMTVEQACRQMKAAYLSVRDGDLVKGDWPAFHANHRYLHNL